MTAEEVCAFGSVGSRLLAACAENGLALKNAKTLDLGEGIVPQGSVPELMKRQGLDAQSIALTAKAFFEKQGENTL